MSQQQSLWRRTTTRRCLIWLSQWSVLSWLVFALAGFITLVALAYALENWRGKRAWEKYRRELEARGERLDLESFVPFEVPDSRNFAMTPFLAPLFDFAGEPAPGQGPWRDTNGFARAIKFADNLPALKDTTGWRDAKKLDLSEWVALYEEKSNRSASTNESLATTPSDRKAAAAAMLQALGPYEPVLNELRAASERPFARFNIRYKQENPFAILLPHLAVVKRVCHVLRDRALAELELGQVDRAFEDLRLMLDSLGSDLAWDNPVIPAIVYLAPRGWFYFEELNYARLFEETILDVGLANSGGIDPSRVRQSGERLEAALNPPGGRIRNHVILSALLLPALGNASAKAALAQTTADETVLACALERHYLAEKSYPEHLDKLAPRFIGGVPNDLITGKPIHYSLTRDGRFLLYSIGWNETDDGGRAEGRSGKSRRAKFRLDEGDWVWRYPEEGS